MSELPVKGRQKVYGPLAGETDFTSNSNSYLQKQVCRLLTEDNRTETLRSINTQRLDSMFCAGLPSLKPLRSGSVLLSYCLYLRVLK